MTWVKVWLPEWRRGNVDAQREVVTRLLNSRVLGSDIEARLREAAHVLAAVSDGLREDTP